MVCRTQRPRIVLKTGFCVRKMSSDGRHWAGSWGPRMASHNVLALYTAFHVYVCILGPRIGHEKTCQTRLK